MDIINVNPNNSYESSASLNQSIFPSLMCDISLPQDKIGHVYFLISQKDTFYFHIGLTLCLITTLRKYNTGGCASDTDIVIHLRPFTLIAYIFGFRNYRQVIE